MNCNADLLTCAVAPAEQVALSMSLCDATPNGATSHRFDAPRAMFPGSHVTASGMWVSSTEGGRMTVTGVSPGGPAARARYVCQGDVIVAVDVGGELGEGTRGGGGGGGGGGGMGKGWVATQLGDHRFVDARLDARIQPLDGTNTRPLMGAER